MRNLEILKTDLDEILSGYEENKLYRAVLKRMQGENVPDEMG